MPTTSARGGGEAVLCPSKLPPNAHNTQDGLNIRRSLPKRLWIGGREHGGADTNKVALFFRRRAGNGLATGTL